MIRTIAIFSAALFLAACGRSGATPSGDPSPLDTLIPWNGDAENVQTTESGLQYVIVAEGPEDGISPSARDTVSVKYEGRLNDGTFFDGNFGSDGLATFGLNGVIKGWTEGVQLMSVGDEFVFYVPTELGYGQHPRPGGVIKPGDDLVFRIKLEDVKQAPPPRLVDAEAWESYTPWNGELESIETTESGLQYVVLATGNEEGISPQERDTVVLYYEGRFDESGETFDSAFDRNEAMLVERFRFMPGFQEALSMMRPGDRWLVHIPSDLAYGPNGYGPIPPDANLNFEIELMDVLAAQ